MSTTCFPDISNNTVIQNDIINDVFSLLEKSNSKKELQDNINNALQQEVEKGTINLESKDIGNISEKLGPALAALTVCKFQNTNVINPADLANNIISLLCNLPKFDFSLFKINLNIDISLLVNEILDVLLQIVLDILISLLSELMSIVVDLCEFTLDIGFSDSVESILTNSFGDLLNSNLFDGLNSAMDILTDIFARFGIDFSTGNYIGATGDDCTPAISTIRPATEFLSSISSILSSKELCQLLNGNASPTTINNIREILEFEYSALAQILNTDEKIRELFIAVGNYIKPDACLTSPQSYDNLCNFNNLEETKRQLLSARGLTQEQIDEAIEADNKRLQDKMLKVANLISNLRKDPSSIFDNVDTNLLCSGNKEGKFKLSSFSKIVNATKIAADVIYDRINMSYISDCQNVVESNVKFITKRRYTPRILNNYTVNNPETGETVVIETALNPKFSVEVEGGNKFFVVKSGGLVKVSGGGVPPINTTGIQNFPDDGFVGDYAAIIANPDAYSQLYSTIGNDILGIVAEFKERISNTYSSSSSTEEDTTTIGYAQTRFGLIYDINSNNKIEGINTKTFKQETATELVLKRPDSNIGFLTENTLIRINDVYARQFDTNKFALSSFEIGSETRSLNSDELSSLENKKAVYTNFTISDGPFRPVEDELKNIILEELPSLSISNVNGLSNQEQVYYELTQIDSTTNSYNKIGSSFLNKINDFINSNTTDSSYTSFVDSYFIEGLLRVRHEKAQFLNKFVNDPCSISMESFGLSTTPTATAIIEQLVRLYIKNHVIRNVVKNIPFLYYFDPFTLVEKDDSFIEFCLSTLKNEIVDMTTTPQNFQQVMQQSIESSFQIEFERSNLTIIDPISGQEYDYSEDEYSLDFKYRYFIKKEFMNLLTSFRQAYQIAKGGELPNNFDQFIFKDIVKNELLPSGLNLVLTYTNTDSEAYTYNSASAFRSTVVAKYVKLSLILNDGTDIYEISEKTNINIFESNPVSETIKLYQKLKNKNEYKILIDFCFNYSKYLSFNHINQLITYGKNYYDSTKILYSTSKTIRDLIFECLSGGNTSALPAPNNCYKPDNSLDYSSLLPDGDFIKEMFLRLLLEAPFTIIKLLAETFDPNISITNQIRNLVSAATSAAASTQVKLPIFPFVAGLWPINFMGWGPPMNPSLGIPYIIVDTIQTSLALANIKVNKQNLFIDFQINIGADISIENPYEKDC
jgi:hypothetical protein